MSDKSGSSSYSGSDSDSYSSSSSDSETSEIPKIVRKSEYDDEFSEHPNFDGWNEAQDPNKPKLKSINTDDRTGNPRVAEILEKLGWGESRKSLSLPVRGGLTSDSHHFGPGYRNGLVTDVAILAYELYPNETTDKIANCILLKKKWGPKSDSSDGKKMSAKKKGSTKKKPKLTEKEKHFARIAYHKREKKRKKKQSAKKKGGKRKRRKTRGKRKKSKRRKTRRKRRKSRRRKTKRRKR